MVQKCLALTNLRKNHSKQNYAEIVQNYYITSFWKRFTRGPMSIRTIQSELLMNAYIRACITLKDIYNYKYRPIAIGHIMYL